MTDEEIIETGEKDRPLKLYDFIGPDPFEVWEHETLARAAEMPKRRKPSTEGPLRIGRAGHIAVHVRESPFPLCGWWDGGVR